jgi:hypothetical protein
MARISELSANVKVFLGQVTADRNRLQLIGTLNDVIYQPFRDPCYQLHNMNATCRQCGVLKERIISASGVAS